ncbi:MAG: YerC/YecD family TrpR-related protein [Candidatus Pacebacteria bacterium]|nr:YerC/YecD family TrpR-related protein [Candidatus Paceibacterota bacterium]
MDWNNKENKMLVRAILALETADETRRFLRDLMTKTEIEEFAKRLQTAELLAASVPYSVIEQKTGLSSTTIARVSKWLNGGMGGYRSVIGKLHHHPAPVARGD